MSSFPDEQLSHHGHGEPARSTCMSCQKTEGFQHDAVNLLYVPGSEILKKSSFEANLWGMEEWGLLLNGKIIFSEVVKGIQNRNIYLQVAKVGGQREG